MKKIAIFLLVLFLIPFTAFGYESSGKAYIKSGFISGVANLNDISNFGGIVIKNIYVADMQKAGFELADIVSVTLANKKIRLLRRIFSYFLINLHKIRRLIDLHICVITTKCFILDFHTTKCFIF